MLKTGSRRGLLVRGLTIGLVLLAVVLTMVTLAGFVGRWLPYFDLINQFRHFALVVAVAGLVLASAVRHRSTMIVFASVTLVHGVFVGPELLAGASARGIADKVGGRTFKIVSYNMQSARTRPSAFRAFIEREAPDVLVLQEASAPVRPLVDPLSDMLPFRADCIGRRWCHVAILSRHRLLRERVEMRQRSPIGNRPPIVEARLEVDGRPITVLGTHLVRPFDGLGQRREFEALGDHLAEQTTATILLTGDFNSAPWSHAMRRFEDAVPLRRATRALFSWPQGCVSRRLCFPRPLLPIDHIFASTDALPIAVRRGPALGSDHYPVIAVFVLR